MTDHIDLSQEWDVFETPSKWTLNESLHVYEEDIVRKYKRNSPVSTGDYTEWKHKPITPDIILSMRLTYAALMLRDLVDIDPEKASGIPVVCGTRFKISQLLAELADGNSVSKVAKEYRLDLRRLQDILHGLSICLDRPFVR
jgi:uncharacterized protein (DUF433 family)